MQKTQQRIIGLYSSVPRSGKSTVARMLTSRGFEQHSLADPIKNMVFSLLRDLDIEASRAYDYITTNKSEVIEELGVNPRHILRTLGTEWGRDCIHPQIWLKAWEARSSKCERVVVDDVRFVNEAELIKSKGGQLWRIVRPGVEDPDGFHASEGGLEGWEFDGIIYNDKTFGELSQEVFDMAMPYLNLKSRTEFTLQSLSA
jgi:hypothetical protein